MKGKGDLHVRVQAFMDRAGGTHPFKDGPLVFGDSGRHVDRYGELSDFPRRFRDHFLRDFSARACEFNGMTAGEYGHRRKNAGAESAGNKVRGRKSFAFALIVFRRVSRDLRSGRRMR